MTAAAVSPPANPAATDLPFPERSKHRSQGRGGDLATLAEARDFALTVDTAIRRDLGTRDEELQRVFDRIAETFERHDRRHFDVQKHLAKEHDELEETLLVAMRAIKDLQDRTISGRIRRVWYFLVRTWARLRGHPEVGA